MRSVQLWLALVCAAVGTAAGGCAGDDEWVNGYGNALNQSTRAVTSLSFLSANGTYGGGCTNRSGSWSISLSPGADLDHPPLSVLKNNTACQLTLTDMNTDSHSYHTASSSPLAASWGTPKAFYESLDTTNRTTVFYANAELSAVSFVGAFELTIYYSDDPTNVDTTPNTANTAVSSTATASDIPAPDYTLNVSGIKVEISTDGNNTVLSLSGDAVLTHVSQDGQNYVIVSDDPGSSYASIDAAYSEAVPTAIPDGNHINYSAFTLADATLPQTRYLIVSNTDPDSSVASYEIFTIHFVAPSQ